MFNTIRRIKWMNIFGLLMFVIVVFVLIGIFSFLNVLVHGDCVERGNLKVCFSVERSALKRGEVTAITTDITNTAETLSDASVSVRMSPNLENASVMAHQVEAMAPGDTVRREFRVKAREELGRFKVEFDIDADGSPDKEVFLTVEKG